MNAEIIKEKSLRNFDSEAEVYEKSSDGKFCSRIYPYILDELNKKNNELILDVGCGNGVMLSKMNENNTLHGVDLSKAMIDVAKKKLKDKAELIVGDAEFLLWEDNYFDTILCTFSFHHYPRPKKVLDEMYRVLKQGGRIILADPWLPTPLRQITNFFLRFSDKGDFHEYSQREITDLLEASNFKLQRFTHPTNDTFLLVAEK